MTERGAVLILRNRSLAAAAQPGRSRRPVVRLLLMGPLLLFGSDRTMLDLLEKLAAALSEGEARLFLDCFDASLAGYAELERNVNALIAQNDIGCSIEILREDADGDSRRLELDWLMELKTRTPGAPPTASGAGKYIRRQVTARCEVRRKNRKWLITSFEPLSLFAPQETR